MELSGSGYGHLAGIEPSGAMKRREFFD
jgi:hypothetical protein